MLNLIVIIVIKKKKFVQAIGPTQSMWIGLDSCDGLDWVGFL